MKAKLSETAKVTVGVKVTVAVQIPAVQEVSVMALKVPWAGGVTIVKASGSPSGSEPISVMVTAVPAAVLTDWRLATGGVFLAEGVPHTPALLHGAGVSSAKSIALLKVLFTRFRLRLPVTGRAGAMPTLSGAPVKLPYARQRLIPKGALSRFM
jgi:hypothetical protein